LPLVGLAEALPAVHRSEKVAVGDLCRRPRTAPRSLLSASDRRPGLPRQTERWPRRQHTPCAELHAV